MLEMEGAHMPGKQKPTEESLVGKEWTCVLKCNGWTWHGRENRRPKVCPNCKQPRWWEGARDNDEKPEILTQ